MRNILSNSEIHPSILDQVQNYESGIITEVKDAIKTNRIVVVGMRWNGSVKQARKNLEHAGLDHKYLEYGSYVQGWYRRLALKMWTGWPTFPMIFVDQQLIGGNADLKKLLQNNQISKS